MKLLPKVYKGITGEPFRTEDYNGAKIEMFYLDETPFLARFASKGKFAVWTSDGENYRLLIEKGYYETLPDLYQPAINVVWLDFMTFAYKTQSKLSRKYSLFTLLTFAISLAAVLLIGQFADDTVGLVVGIGILFVGLYTFSRKQQKDLQTHIRAENVIATQKIKDIIGEKEFENLLNDQQAYYEKYFAFEDDEALEDDVQIDDEELDTLEYTETEEKETIEAQIEEEKTGDK